MIELIFDLCVQLLVWLAQNTGTTYKAINVWIFVIVWPILTLGMVAIIVVQAWTLRRLRAQQSSAK